ncbi:MAG TPA: hypothetical protein VFB72_09970 [Verrucomicrobiae bacterium]|nr:hypothetical protein [Verrucomicrobiae bacterium]
MKPIAKTYTLRMSLGLILYAAALCLAHYVHENKSLQGYWPLYLLPVLAVVYIAATIVRFVVTTLDELQKKIILEAAAFSAIATGFSCISYLFLENAGAPQFRAEWGFYLMWIYYGIGLFFSARRYR